MKYLIALIFSALLVACAGPTSGIYNDDRVKDAITRQNWNAAYRYLEYDLASDIPKHRAFALDMIREHPEIKDAADLIFVNVNIQSRLNKIPRGDRNELRNEGQRIEIYRLISSVTDYESSRAFFESQIALREENDARFDEENRLSAEKKRIAIEEARLKKEAEKSKLLAALIQAAKGARFSCKGKAECDKAFSLTQIYLSENSDMKIQVATDTIVETYNPTDSMKIGIKATKQPQKGDRSEIVLTANCKDEKNASFEEVCNNKLLPIYREFPDFIKKSIQP